MAPKSKINHKQLKKLRDSGLTMRQIAETMGIGLGSVHKIMTDINKKTVGEVMVRGREDLVGVQIQQREFDKIYKSVDRELTKIHSKLADTSLTATEQRAWESIALQHVEALRRLWTAYADILGQLASVGRVTDFINTVLTVIGECDEQIRQEILNRLKGRFGDFVGSDGNSVNDQGGVAVQCEGGPTVGDCGLDAENNPGKRSEV
jgi:hypothetical protein